MTAVLLTCQGVKPFSLPIPDTHVLVRYNDGVHWGQVRLCRSQWLRRTDVFYCFYVHYYNDSSTNRGWRDNGFADLTPLREEKKTRVRLIGGPPCRFPGKEENGVMFVMAYILRRGQIVRGYLIGSYYWRSLSVHAWFLFADWSTLFFCLERNLAYVLFARPCFTFLMYIILIISIYCPSPQQRSLPRFFFGNAASQGVRYIY